MAGKAYKFMSEAAVAIAKAQRASASSNRPLWERCMLQASEEATDKTLGGGRERQSMRWRGVAWRGVATPRDAETGGPNDCHSSKNTCSSRQSDTEEVLTTRSIYFGKHRYLKVGQRGEAPTCKREKAKTVMARPTPMKCLG